MKKFPKILLIILLILLGLTFLIYFLSGLISPKMAEVKINDNFSCHGEVVKNFIRQAQGLSGTNELNKFDCMIFVYNDSKNRTFWMRDMNYPIDIIFIENNEIVDVRENLEKPKKDNIPQYTSKKPADTVIELKKGVINEFNIKIGDKISFNS